MVPKAEGQRSAGGDATRIVERCRPKLYLMLETPPRDCIHNLQQVHRRRPVIAGSRARRPPRGRGIPLRVASGGGDAPCGEFALSLPSSPRVHLPITSSFRRVGNVPNRSAHPRPHVTTPTAAEAYRLLHNDATKGPTRSVSLPVAVAAILTCGGADQRQRTAQACESCKRRKQKASCALSSYSSTAARPPVPELLLCTAVHLVGAVSPGDVYFHAPLLA